ncbi:MAG: AAA family ATPase [bacterium]
MNYQDLQKEAHIYRGALLQDAVVSVRVRRAMRLLCAVLALLCAVVWAFSRVSLRVPTVLFASLAPYAHFFEVGVLLFGASWLLLALLAVFYNSYFFLDIEPMLAEPGLGAGVPLSYEVAQMVSGAQGFDATRSLLQSGFGVQVLLRLGLGAEVIVQFLKTRTTQLDNTRLQFVVDMVTAPVFAQAVYQNDQEFSAFLFALGVQEKEFQGACDWVLGMHSRAKRTQRWWSRESLGRVPSIGKAWSYGQIRTLQNFSTELFPDEGASSAATTAEVDQLENILVRARGSNALIVADAGSGEMDIVYGLIRKIRMGTAFPQLEGKRVLQFRAGALIDAARGDKTTFETAFNVAVGEAIDAGDIILLFDDLPSLVENAHSIGVDFATLIAPFLDASGIQVIAFADKARYHDTIERSATLRNGFEVVRVTEKDERLLTSILESEVVRVEAQTGVFFTFQAVEVLVEGVARYFADRSPLEKAKDLLEEIPRAVLRSGKSLVERADVQALIEAKTGVPSEGVVSDREKEKLLTLESVLHSKVVGQNEAIDAIAGAMRRARAGLRNPARPIGSFLFLGPTGVGKTETAKALEEVFFGTEVPLLRLDMSEYSGADALQRLTGSLGGGAGTLVALLRDQQYGVLLLDEFEKASPEVHNLFLQVLDEGVFSDMQGRKVNARNTIIVATSNAGSERIFALVAEGKDLVKEKDALITEFVEGGIFRPELINRFDGVILFHPLQQEDMAAIATLQVKRLAGRLVAQGLKLVVTDDLIQYLARNGFDEKFGARPMNRVLQEQVEKLLAEKLLKGELKKGSSIELTASPEVPGTLVVRTL